MTTRFAAQDDEHGYTLQLMEAYRSMFRLRERALPVADWTDRSPSSAIDLVARLLDELSDEPREDLQTITGTSAAAQAEQISESSVHISHPLAASFNDRQASAAGLPDSAPLSLRVDRSGPLTDVKTRLSAHWSLPDGRTVRPKITGSLTLVGEKRYRLPASLYNTVIAIDRFNAERSPDINTRLAHLAHLKDVVGDYRDAVTFERRLSETTLSQAHSFSLDLGDDPAKLDFSPVLNGPADENGRQYPLLNATEQQQFATRLFTNSDTARPSYFISNDHYLFVSPELLPALNVVREVQSADAETKRSFLRSPAGYIRNTLEETGQITEDTGYVLDQVFVETSDFSDRVTGIGLWEDKPESEIPPEVVDWFPVEPEPAEKPEKTGSTGSGTADNPNSPDSYGTQAEGNEDDVDYDPGEDITRAIENIEPEIPAGLVSTLRSHQRTGLVWLQTCWQNQRRGALLADDMGVGKTIQTIAFLRWLQEREHTKQYGPLMVVAPVSLLDNWQHEIDIHLDTDGLGSMALLYADGLRQFRSAADKDIRSGIATLAIDKLKTFDLLLTTYETLRDYSISLAQIPLTCIVFDEMQKVKNPGSLMTRASKSMNAKFSLGLTGTPIENTVADLWCMLDTLLPGTFGSRSDFLALFGAGASDDYLAQLGNRLMNTHNEEPPYLLRRLKTDIGEELPPKTQRVLPEVMPEPQQDRYDSVLRAPRTGSHSSALAAIQKMRNVSLHPDGKDNSSDITDDEYIARSARMSQTFNILDDIHHKREKALVFVENLDVAARLAVLIRRRYNLRHTPARIFGATPAFRRQKIVNDFSNNRPGEFDVLVLSPKAAGVGLNIIAANHVIHLTRWWNPAVEDQCTDRAYRIKQDKPVTVYLPLSTHPSYPNQSFDELLHAMLERKRAVAQGVLMHGEKGNEATEILRQMAEAMGQAESATGNKRTDQHDTPSANPVAAPVSNGPEFASVLEHTLFPGTLAELLSMGISPPEVGLDVAREDGAIFTNLEWAWEHEKVGLADAPPEEELQQLIRLGWRITDQPNDIGIRQLSDWLRH